MKQPIVLFSARELQNTSPSVGTTLLYNTVECNIGNAFSQATGIFTAPVNGTYQFSVIVCTRHQTWGSIQILMNQQAVQSINNYNGKTSQTTVSGMIILQLTKGDQVQIKQHYTTGGYLYNNYCGNQFNGALIYKHHWVSAPELLHKWNEVWVEVLDQSAYLPPALSLHTLVWLGSK